MKISLKELEENTHQMFLQINTDLEAVDTRLNCHHREINQVHNHIDLFHTPTINVLTQLKYLEEMNVEREKRINNLEETLVSVRPCHCCQDSCPGSWENPIKVGDLEYTKKYHMPPIKYTLETEEGEADIVTDRSIDNQVVDFVTILKPITPEGSVHLC